MAANYDEVKNSPATLALIDAFVSGKARRRAKNWIRVQGNEYWGIIDRFRLAGVDPSTLSKDAANFITGGVSRYLIYKHKGRGRLKVRKIEYDNLGPGIYKELVDAYAKKNTAAPKPAGPIGAPPPKPTTVPSPAKSSGAPSFPSPSSKPPDGPPVAGLALLAVALAVVWLLRRK